MAAHRGGELCNSGILDKSQTDSAVIATLLDADDYLQHDIDSPCKDRLSIQGDI